MIKELFITVILGALLGFGLTGGFLAVKNHSSNQTSTLITITPIPSNADVKSSPAPTETILSTGNDQIVIDYPLNESIVTNSKITLKGNSSSKSTLIITTPLKTYYTTADDTGHFSLDIEIDSGANLIQIDSIDSQDNQSTTQILVTYSTAKF